MKNFEAYEDKIKELEGNVALNKSNELVSCIGFRCCDCKFDSSNGKYCSQVKFEWLYEEYKEPIKLTRLEYEILKYYFKQGYRYIARNGNSDLRVFVDCPKRELNHWCTKNISDKWDEVRMDEFFHFNDTFFDFAGSYDKEPYSIRNVLKKCEVMKDD